MPSSSPFNASSVGFVNPRRGQVSQRSDLFPSNSVTSGPLAPTRAFERSNLVRQAVATFGRNWGDYKKRQEQGLPPPTRLAASKSLIFGERGTNLERIADTQAKGDKHANLRVPPKDGKLHLTGVSMVSLHSNEGVKFANSPSEAFVINVDGPTGSEQMQVPRVSSTGEQAIFVQDFAIDVSKPGTYTVSMYPKASAGAAGFSEGRTYHLHVGAENFVTAAQLNAKTAGAQYATELFE